MFTKPLLSVSSISASRGLFGTYLPTSCVALCSRSVLVTLSLHPGSTLALPMQNLFNLLIDSLGIFKDVRFHPTLKFGHFWAPLALDLPHNVKNHGGGSAEEVPGGFARERRTKENKEHNTWRITKTNRNKTTMKDTGCGTSNIVFDFW